MKKWSSFALLASLVFVLRFFIGLQINFSHEDYLQIYLIGLESFSSYSWPYWGPDIVWSARQLPGALQAYLVSLPLQITKLPSSPIFLANIISFSGMILLAWYGLKRFQNLSGFLLLLILGLLPYSVLNGAVLLNTSYLLFTGAILFIATAELFIYQSHPIIKKTWLVPASLGFAFFITFQLHLTWVMFLPFLAYFLFFEFHKSRSQGIKFIGLFLAGGALPMILVLPTIFKYPGATFFNSEGSLVFEPERILKFFDVFIRYISTATFNLNPNSDIARLAEQSFSGTAILLYILKVLAGIQLIAILYGSYLKRKEAAFRRLGLLFLFTLTMNIGLYVLSNKHLSSRTFILLWPIPVWVSFYAYDALRKWKIAFPVLYGYLIYQASIIVLIAALTYHGEYSLYSRKEAIEKAIETGDHEFLGIRRRTISPTE